jgi:hypothetical protein
MPRYYCDYCDVFLTHDSPSVRKQHNRCVRGALAAISISPPFTNWHSERLVPVGWNNL